MYAGALVRTLKLTVFLVLCSASRAQAWQVFLQVSSEVTLRGSSETSTAASRAERDDRGPKTGAQGSQCSTDTDCSGYCDLGTCVDPLPAQPAAPAPRMPACIDDQSCAVGYACREQRCVELTGPQPQPPALERCDSDAQCTQGQRCVGGQCLSPPPPPPSSSLQRRGFELYLRDRAVPLQQDLALGEGPVISLLATELKVSAPRLGRTLRAHRAPLAALVGDASATDWPRRFLGQLDALCAPSVRVARR